MNPTAPVVTPIAGAPITTSGPTNGAYDSNGNLLFYVKDLQVFKPGSSTPVGSLAGSANNGSAPGPELEIVPVPGQENCGKFYVIYQASGALYYSTISWNNGVITSVPAFGSAINAYNYPQNHLFDYNIGLAVSKMTTSGVRYLFTLVNDGNPQDPAQGSLYRLTISSTGISPN
ncbi:MAG TPA: hypothetical protein VK835_01040, partial [Bacteroidia bacterium]|nr:hypothetical protein [Bacteroidia bacterium]